MIVDIRREFPARWVRWRLSVIMLYLIAAVAGSSAHAEEIDLATIWQGPLPVVLDEDVDIVDGAQLTIAAGTRIEVQSGVSIRVLEGSIVALGAENAAIEFVSASSQSPGAWGVIEFADAQRTSRFDHVLVRHGSGIEVTSASPQLDHVRLLDNDGAAIRIDLSSSPFGVGLVAEGNGIDAILVPPGSIRSEVRWGLKGIPYVVPQGVVRIGDGELAFVPASLSLDLGNPAPVIGTLLLTLPEPVAVEGLQVALSSSVSSVAAVAADVAVPFGATDVAIPVTALTAGTTRIDATVPGTPPAVVSAQIDVLPAPALSLTPHAVALGEDETRTFTVTANRAPQADLDIALTQQGDGNVSILPQEVQIASGESEASFDVTAGDLGEVLLSAEAAGYTRATAQIAVRAVGIVLPANVIVGRGATRSFHIELSQPATETVEVELLLADSAVASLASTNVQIDVGQSSATVDITGSALGGETALTAQADGYAQAQTLIVARNFALSFAPASKRSIPSNLFEDVRVRLQPPAPPGGLTVSLSSDAGTIAAVYDVPDRAQPLSEITFAEDASERAVSIRAFAPLAATTVRATADGVAPAALAVETLAPVHLQFNTPNVRVAKWLRSPAGLLDVALRSGASAYSAPADLQIALTAVSPVGMQEAAVAPFPAMVTIAKGASSAGFALDGLALTPDGNASLGASADGIVSANMGVAVDEPQLEFVGLDGSRSLDGQTPAPADAFSLRWRFGYSTDYKPIAAQTIALAVTRDDTGSTPLPTLSQSSTSFIAAQNASQSRTLGGASAPVRYRINATHDGETWTSGVQAIGLPKLRIASDQIIVAKGWENEFIVRREVGGQAYVDNTAVPFDVEVDGPGAASVAALSGEIPANQSEAKFRLRGLSVSSDAIEIVAVPQGAAAATHAASDLHAVTVQLPQVGHYIVPKSPIRIGEPNLVQMTLNRGSGSPYRPIPPASSYDVDITVSPAGAVGGPQTQTVHFNDGEVESVAIGNALQAGTYEIVFSSGGEQLGTYPVVVEPMQIYASPEQFSVGTGMQMQMTIQRQHADVAVELALVATPSGHVQLSENPVVFDIGESSRTITVQGLVATAPGVTLDIAAPQAGVERLARAHVVVPELRFNGLDALRTPASVIDEFGIELVVASTSTNVATAAMSFDLALVDPAPTDVVAGLSPTSVTIAAGTSGATASVGAVQSAGGSYRVRATHAGSPALTALSAVQSVRPLALNFLELHAIAGTGMEIDLGLWRETGGGAAPQQDILVQLPPGTTAVELVDDTVTFDAGSEFAYVRLRGIEPTTAPIVLTASAAGHAQTSIAIDVAAPQLQFSALPGTHMQNGATTRFVLEWRVATDPARVQTPIDETSLSIDIVPEGATPASIIPGFLVDETPLPVAPPLQLAGFGGSNSVTGYLAPAVATGSYRLRATSGTQHFDSNVQTVIAPTLRAAPEVHVGLGLKTCIWVADFDGGEVSGPQAQTGASEIIVGASVEGGYCDGVWVAGEVLTSGTPAALTISRSGYASASVDVHVLEPSLGFYVPRAFLRGSGETFFYAYWMLPGIEEQANQQHSRNETSITFDILSPAPAAAVDGLRLWPGTSLQPSLEVSIPQNQPGTYPTHATYLATGAVSGSFRLRATAGDGRIWSTDTLHVGEPALKFYGNADDPQQHRIYAPIGSVSGGNAALATAVENIAIATQTQQVTLSCLDPDICVAESPVSTNHEPVSFELRGLSEGSTQLIAQAPGLPESRIDVTIVRGAIAFRLPESPIAVGTDGWLGMQLSVPGSDGSGWTWRAPVQATCTSSASAIVQVAPAMVFTGENNLAFRALAAGSAIVTCNAAGIDSGSITIEVTP